MGASTITDCAVKLGSTSLDYLEDPEPSINKAREEGFEIIESAPTKLLLDLDTQEARDKLLSRIQSHNRLFGSSITISDEWRSKSGNWHVVCDTNGKCMSINARIVTQMFLGSDPSRAMYEQWRLLRDTPPNRVSVLFRPRAAVLGHDKSWFESIPD